MRSKRQNKKLLLLILLLTVTVGFALLSTTLQINGISRIKGNIWNIHWDSTSIRINNDSIATATGPEVSTVTTTDDTVAFEVNLELPGEFFEFTVDAVNEGTIDGYINNVSKFIYDKDDYDTNGDNATALDPEDITFTVVYDDNGEEPASGDMLAKRVDAQTPTTRRYKVRVEFNEDATSVPEEDITYMCVFKTTYGQNAPTSPASPSASSITYLTRQVEGEITPGDVIGIGNTEDFYVISSDSTKTVLLAKNNLLVGYENSEDTGWEDVYYSPSTTAGYGLQSVDAIGYANEEWHGTVYFSATNYWDDGSGNLLSPYNANGASYEGNPYPFVYNPTYDTEPDFENDGFSTEGYSIAYYVEEYVNRLKIMGAPSTITGRLLSYEEADGAQNIEDNGTSIIFDGIQDYWLGSAGSSNGDSVWGVCSDSSGFYDNYRYYDDFLGVRPVIEISTSDI